MPETYWRTRTATGVWDYVIVGAGSAGCVLANRLTEDTTTRVLLLEAGGTDLNPFIQIPAAIARMPASVNWSWEAEPDASRNGVVERWGGGRVLGGSSSINGQMWTRGNRADYDEWAELGADGWDYESVLPYFRRAETFEGGEDDLRGGHGPQAVSFSRTYHVLTERFLEAACAAGHPFRADYNGRCQEGVARAQLSQRRGFRAGTGRAYLAPARRRPNLDVVLGAEVARVLLENGRAVGVEYRRGGELRRAGARREVVLSAGSFATPGLLQRSGIGPADHLRELGVPVVVDAPEVGRNLQEHLYSGIMVGVTVPTLNTQADLRGVVKGAVDLVLRGRGAATTAIGQALVFGRLDPTRRDSEYEILFSPLGVESRGYPGHEASAEHSIGRAALVATPTVSCAISVAHPYARGSVALRSADPVDRPIVRHELLGDPRDVDTLIGVARVARRIFRESPLAAYVIGETVPGPAVETDDQWREHLRGSSIVGQHPVGTARMGDDEASVVDPALRVRGVDALRVVDASVMPTLITGHTNAPTIMIAERASDLIRIPQSTVGDRR